MRSMIVATLILTLLTGAVLAQGPSKVQELQARGIQNWTPGQGKVPGAPAFAVVPSRPAPAGPSNIADTQTMQYDDGNLTALPTVFGQVFGNRFSQGIGGVELNTLTLNSFQFYFLEDSLPDTALFFLAGPPSGTMSVQHLVSTNVAGLMNSGANFSAPVLNIVDASMALGAGPQTMYNDQFFLGGWCVNSATMFPVNNEMIGLATNGPRQQGYTAVSGDTVPVAFVGQAFNAILRANVTSASMVPVELMNFGVE